MSDPKRFRIPVTTDGFAALTFMAIGIVSLLVVRGALFYYISGDYINFLGPWIEQYQTMTFFEGLGARIGNYNPPYLYILNLISRIGSSELFYIKLVSVVFDFLLAFFVMKIISLKTDSKNIHILAFLLTLAIPTVVLNSSMWGQCDSIYVSFAIGSFYFGFTGRGKSAFAFMAIAVSFKIQAVFLMPVLPVLIFMNKIKLRDCYMFFVVYILMMLPAIIGGRSILDLLFTYFMQANYFSQLNMNVINVWRFIGNVEYESFRLAGLYIAGIAILSLLYFTYINRNRLTSQVDYIRLAYLSAVLMPYLLPKMHDRYFLMADVLSLVLFFYDKKRWYVPLVTIICSYITYAYFLMGGVVLFDNRLAALALLIIIIIVLRDYVMSLYHSSNDPAESVTCDSPNVTENNSDNAN